jgi:cold shock protein
MATGSVKFFNRTKNFGFISPDDGSKDVFVHGSNVLIDANEFLQEGELVEYEVGEGRK